MAEDNRKRWDSWKPIQSNCYAGYGVVDSLGNKLLNRTGAVGCSVCPDGTSEGSWQVGIQSLRAVAISCKGFDSMVIH